MEKVHVYFVIVFLPDHYTQLFDNFLQVIFGNAAKKSFQAFHFVAVCVMRETAGVGGSDAQQISLTWTRLVRGIWFV
jgi:hypothetical protein